MGISCFNRTFTSTGDGDAKERRSSMGSRIAGLVLLLLPALIPSSTDAQQAPSAPPSFATWTWMSGANTPNANPVYGTKGVAASANVPGARREAVSFTDAAGNFWVFGGWG